MRKKGLLDLPCCHEPETDSEEYVIAVSRIHVDESSEGRNITEIDLWYRNELRVRWFGIYKDDEYASYLVGDGWRNVQLDNAARIIRGESPLSTGIYCRDQKYGWDTAEDKKNILGELKTSNVEYFETHCAGEKRYAAHVRKVRRVAELMASVPTMPDEAEDWVQDVVFPENMMFIEKKENERECRCTACGYRSAPEKGWKHNARISCPSCKKEVIAKRLVSRVEKKQKVTIFFELDKKNWVERIFTAKCVWQGTAKKTYLNAEITAVIPKGEFRGKVYYGQCHERDEFAQDWWISNPINKRWGDALLYPGNLKEILPMTGLQNSGIDIMAEKGILFDVNTFIVTFANRPYMEYLIKGGFTEMAADILRRYSWWSEPSGFNHKAKNLRDFFQLDGNHLNRLKQMNGGIGALKWLRYECDSGSRVSQESLEYLEKNNVYPEDMWEWLEELGSVQRVVNYLKKQKTKPLNTIGTWKDYLNMARAEGMDIEDDIVRFPKDLKARHDALVEIRNERRDAEIRKAQEKKYAEFDLRIMQNLPRVKLYYWQNEDYVFIPAGKCEELMKEGRTLHHCVGASDRYMKKMADGESWILFLRKRSDIEKAYYTIEINMSDDKILQWYSAYDRKPDEKIISRLLTEYKKYLAAVRTKEKKEAAGRERMLTAG